MTKSKYDTYYCPCGCGNHGDKASTQKEIDDMRKLMKGQRYCMDRETTKIFLPSVEDIKKHGYTTVEKYTLEEFLEGAETEHDKWAHTSMYRMLTSSNAFINSEENRIDR